MSRDHTQRLLKTMLDRVSKATVDSELRPLVTDLRGLLSAGNFDTAFIQKAEDEIYVLDGQDDARQPWMPAYVRDDHAVLHALGNLVDIIQKEIEGSY